MPALFGFLVCIHKVGSQGLLRVPGYPSSEYTLLSTAGVLALLPYSRRCARGVVLVLYSQPPKYHLTPKLSPGLGWEQRLACSKTTRC